MARLNFEQEQEENGVLFNDIIFFVLQRVPNRSALLELITRNGGTLTALQEKADIVIADHARKDCPNNSISWKWVEESVKCAALEDKDKWRAGPKGNASRPVGASTSTQKQRNPYSKDDDIFVWRFVNDPKRATLSDKGNSLYQELEKEVRT